MSNVEGFDFARTGDEMMTDLFAESWRLAAAGAGAEDGLCPPEVLRAYLEKLGYGQLKLLKHSVNGLDIFMNEMSQRDEVQP